MPEIERPGEQEAKIEASDPDPIRSPDATEAELLASLDRRELLCPRCTMPLEGTLVVADIYQGIWLRCGACGFQEL
jgi:hypothetical protein